jgi:hypothetical protein
MTESVPIQIAVILALAGVYTLWVLLPLIPATLIYWLFPNTSVGLGGPLAGLTLKTSGAFAAYLVVVIVTYTQIDKINNAIEGLEHQYWTVIGKVNLLDAQGRQIDSEKIINDMVVVTQPATHLITKYKIQLRLVEEPLTVLKIPQFGETLLEWTSAEKNSSTRIINIKNPIIIKQEASTSVPVSSVPSRWDSALGDSSAQH